MKKIILIFLILFLVLAQILSAQNFGQNKVQYTDFDWKYLQSKHFDVYFYQGGKRVAEFVADLAETSYISLQSDLRYELLDRITIILYNSHNDFEQTNVDLSTPQESVGGFTEFLKNRVVLPFEGNYETLRHVVHHELTHAVFLQMIYGPGTQSIISGMMSFQMPLWLIEGLAEYSSLRWDTESDMFMRDATLIGYLPPISSINGFLNYKAGQHLLVYLAGKYGPEIIGEILNTIKQNKSVEKGFQETIGIGVEELSKRWHGYAKKEYWPDIATSEEPDDFATRLTDHLKTGNFVNNSPALSPQGDKIAFLSNRSDYFDIYLISAIDGRILSRIVKGQRTMDLEELNWLQPGITWSPDGKKIAFTAKKGPNDVLHIVDIKKIKNITTYEFEFDGLHSPDWSPDGKEIAFSAVKDGASDIFIYNIETNRFQNITCDLYSDLQPSWSPDGEWITFTSDRGQNLFSGLRNIARMPIKSYYNFDIYTIHTKTAQIKRITNTEYLERNPTWSPDGKYIAFVSDQSGIFNLYLKNLETKKSYPITNVITGIFQPHWEKNNLVFTTFYQGGYDIFLLKNPADIKPGSIQLKDTQFIKKFKAGTVNTVSRNYRKRLKKTQPKIKLSSRDYKTFVFDKNFKQTPLQTDNNKNNNFFPDSTAYKLPTGGYIENDYKILLSPDLMYGNTGYSQFFGVQGSMVIALSDVLGNHRLNIFSNMFYDIQSSDYQLSYFYLPRKTDVGIGAFQYSYYFATSFGSIVQDRNYGLSLYLSRPFDRYRRFELSMVYFGIHRQDINSGFELYHRRLLITGLQYVKDTALWGYTGPVNGQRSNVSLTFSPYFGYSSLDFRTVSFDYRKYYKLAREYNFVLRVAGGASFGKNAQRFFLGGMDNWINPGYRGGSLQIDDADDIYFAYFETPLRGADYYEQIGTRFFLTNLELRFPFIRYFVLGFPPMFFSNIRGTLFLDMGAAWSKEHGLRMFKKDKDNFIPRLASPIAGMGFGMRINMGIFLLRYDLAWRADISGITGKPKSYFSLGAEF